MLLNFIHVFYQEISWRLALSPFLDVCENKIIFETISNDPKDEISIPGCLKFIKRIKKGETSFFDQLNDQVESILVYLILFRNHKQMK